MPVWICMGDDEEGEIGRGRGRRKHRYVKVW